MHESSTVRDIVTKARDVAASNQADHVDTVRIEIGAMSHVTPEAFMGHFALFAEHTPLEGAKLDISVADDQTADDARDVRLVSIVLGEA